MKNKNIYINDIQLDENKFLFSVNENILGAH